MTVFSKFKRTSKEYQTMQAKKAEIGTPPAIDFWIVNQVREGPYKITNVYNNGNLEVQTSDAVTERVSIRRVTPNFK